MKRTSSFTLHIACLQIKMYQVFLAEACAELNSIINRQLLLREIAQEFYLKNIF